MGEIRVGDVVERIGYNNMVMKLGDTGEVIEVHRGHVFVKGYKRSDRLYEIQALDNVKVIHKTIRVGDIVERIKFDNAIMKIGSTGEVTKLEDDGAYVKGFTVYGGTLEWQNNDYLKVIKRKEECEKNVEDKQMKETNIQDRIQEMNKLISDIYNGRSDDKIDSLKYNVESYKRNIEDGYDHIKRCTKRLKDAMIELKAYENKREECDFTSDIKALLDHDMVEDVKVEGNVVEVYTDYIDIYDEDGNRYRGNKYKLVFSYARMSVRIYGLDEDYNRRSYWTGHDPHPHVDGDGGYPCLGDAGSMLASTMNDYEIYASFIITLNFLQQVNTDDPAGEYICNWDCVDEEGNIIDNPHEREEYMCNVCSYSTYDRDEVTVCGDCEEYTCTDCRTYITSTGCYVCDNCLNDNYARCKECGDYHRTEDMNEVGDEYICGYCADRYYETCSNCDELVHRDNGRFINRNFYCDDCADDMENEE